MTRLLFLIAVSILVVPRASAQAPAVTPAECSYEDCALRVEPRVFGAPRILRGNAAAPVGRIGLFGTDLSRAVSDNEVAYGYARSAEKAQGPILALAIAGGALLAYSVVYYQTDRIVGDNFYPQRSDNTAHTVALIGGFALSAAGGVLQIRASQAQSRAVWEYNRGLAARD